MKTTALLATGIDRVELVGATLPDPGAGEVLIETLYSVISPGTELRCLAGRQPMATFPFVPGYSAVGRVVACGAGASLEEGTWVFGKGSEKSDRPLLWGGHTAHAVCQAAAVFVVPPGVEPLDAVFAKLAAIAYRGVRIAGTRPHEQVAVVGLGPVGQLAARLHTLVGARTLAADLDPGRVAVARAAGIDAFVPDRPLPEAFRAVQPDGADVVVDATGAASVLPMAVLLGRTKPWDDSLTEPVRLVVQGSYPGSVTFDYHDAFRRELSVLFPRDNQPRDTETALRLMAEGRLRPRDLASRIAPPEAAPEIYANLRAAEPGLLTAVFQWHAA